MNHNTVGQLPVAILAGGLATRLGPLARQVPKSLLRVAGRPFVDHQLALLARQGMRQVVLCIGHLGQQIEEHVGDGRRFGLEVRFCHDGPQLLGTGGALRRALPLLGEAFWVLYGDSYLDIDYQAVLDHFRTSDALALMTILGNADRWDRSNVVYREGRLISYCKRSPHAEAKHIDYGLAILRRAALVHLPLGQACDLADIYSELVAAGRMIGHEVQRRFYEIGSPAGLTAMEAYLSWSTFVVG
jgi:NDP-sugar pyrophosphorylase family protein